MTENWGNFFQKKRRFSQDFRRNKRSRIPNSPKLNWDLRNLQKVGGLVDCLFLNGDCSTRIYIVYLTETSESAIRLFHLLYEHNPFQDNPPVMTLPSFKFNKIENWSRNIIERISRGYKNRTNIERVWFPILFIHCGEAEKSAN